MGAIKKKRRTLATEPDARNDESSGGAAASQQEPPPPAPVFAPPAPVHTPTLPASLARPSSTIATMSTTSVNSKNGRNRRTLISDHAAASLKRPSQLNLESMGAAVRTTKAPSPQTPTPNPTLATPPSNQKKGSKVRAKSGTSKAVAKDAVEVVEQQTIAIVEPSQVETSNQKSTPAVQVAVAQLPEKSQIPAKELKVDKSTGKAHSANSAKAAAPTFDDGHKLVVANNDIAKKISTFLQGSLLSRTFVYLAGTVLEEDYVARIHIRLFAAEPWKLSIAERFVFQKVMAHLAEARVLDMLTTEKFPLRVDDVILSPSLRDFALIKVSSATNKEEHSDVVVLAQTGETIPWMSSKAFETLAGAAEPHDPPPKRQPMWSKGDQAAQLCETAERFLLAGIDRDVLKSVIEGFLRRPHTKRFRNVIAADAGYRTLGDHMADQIAYCRHLDPLLAEILPSSSEDPLLILRLTGEIVGQAGEIQSPLWSLILQNAENWPAQGVWEQIVDDRQNRGQKVALESIQRVGAELRAGKMFWQGID